jgi:O-methyltransferase
MKPRQLVIKLLQATKLNRIAHRLYYRHFHGFESASRSTVEAVEKVFDRAQQKGSLEGGDYYEFGLFKGYSFWSAQQKANLCGARSMHFFGFDSFEGLPEVTGHDKTERDHFYKGQYHCSYDTVCASLDDAGIDWNRTTLICGYFDESLKGELHREHGMRPISIALIDCDLYSSTVDVLRFIAPLIQDQSILIFDDWNCFEGDNDKGQRKAFAELLARRADLRAEPLFEYGTWGQVFLIHQP